MSFRITLLGPPRLCVGQDSHPLTSDLPGALLAALALRGGWVGRDWLLALFWPDAPAAAAQHSLRVNLHRLRRYLSGLGCGQALVAQSRQLRLDASTDVARFRAAAGAGQTGEALAAYRGPLLCGWSLRAFDTFDTWIGEQRDSLAGSYRQLTMAHAAALELRGDAVGSAQVLLNYLHDDVLAEDMLQALLQLAAEAGQVTTAKLLYERFRQRAQADLGVAPLPATQRLARQLDGESARPKSGPAPSALPAAAWLDAPPWTGREAEQAWLRAAGTSMTVVRGEPGAGKTRLLQQVYGGSALWLRCTPGTRAEPLAPIVRWLEEHAAEAQRWPRWRANARRLGRLCPALLPGELAPPVRAAAALQLPTVLAELLAWQGRPIVVDDLQWADTATLAVLGRLRQHAAVRLVATLRAEALDPPVAAWLRAAEDDAGLRMLELAPLSTQDFSAWLRAVGVEEARCESLAEWLGQRSGGNPYLAVETMRSLLEAGHLQHDGGRLLVGQWPIDAGRLPLPAGALRTVQGRVNALSTRCQSVLAIAAIAGDAADIELLSGASDLSPWHVAGALAEAQRAGLLRGRRFAHDLVRDAIVQQLDEPRSVVIHAGIVSRAAGRWPPERLAAHAWATGCVELAVGLTVDACRAERARGLHAQAAERSERALAHELPPPQFARLACERAQTAFDLGDAVLTRAWLRRVHDSLPEPGTRALALVVEADLALLEGRLLEAARLAEEAVQCDGQRPEVQALRAVIAHQRGDYEAAVQAFAVIAARERSRPPSVALADALTNLGTAHDAAGRPSQGLRHHQEAWALAQRLGARHLQVRIGVNLMESLRTLGRTEEAIAVGRSALALGTYDATPAVLNNLAGAALQAGGLADARRWSERLVEADDPSLRCLSRARLLRICALSGDSSAAACWAPRVLEAMAQTEMYLPRAAAIASLLDHADPALHAAALTYLRDEPLPPAVQHWLDGAVARHAQRQPESRTQRALMRG